MTADVNTEFVFKGSIDDIESALKIVYEATNETNKCYFTLIPEYEKQIRTAIERFGEKKGDIYTYDTDLAGPYGQYSLLDEVEIFNVIAEKVPNVSFTAKVVGSLSTSNQYLEVEYKGGNVDYCFSVYDFDQMVDEYVLKSTVDVSADKFKEMFEIQGDFTQEAYQALFENIVMEIDDELEALDFDTFQFFLEKLGLETELDEGSFGEVIEAGFEELGYITRETFEEEEYVPEPTNYYYDLKDKKWVEKEG